MNICLVSLEYPPDTARGGIGTQNWNKARTLARLGHTVHVLSCAAKKGAEVQTRLESGVMVHRIEQPGFEFPVYHQPAYWVGHAWMVYRQLQRLMAETPFDVLDFAEYGAEGFAYQLDRTPWNWAPVVVQLHGPLAMCTASYGWPARDGEFYRVGTFMEDVSIKAADALMACSANIADFTAQFHGVPRAAIDVVHCGVDAEAFRPRADAPNDEGRPTVLFVGNVSDNKGVKTVLDAVLRLHAAYPEIRLQILGKGDADAVQRFRARAQRAGAEANVEFLGFIDRERLPEFYRRAAVFASPAQSELGVANVYIEAMASGCPVVASTTGGAPEAIADGVTGLLVPPDDPAATAAALDRILGDRSLARNMGAAGRRRVDEYFAMDHYITRVLATYQKAIDLSRQKLAASKAESGMED